MKALVLCDAKLHALCSAAAALEGVSKNAFAVEAIRKATRGLVIMDRRKLAGSIKITDRAEGVDEINEDATEAAWIGARWRS